MVAVSLKKKKHPTPPPPPPTHLLLLFSFFFFQAEDGIRDSSTSRGLGDVYKRQRVAGDPFEALVHEEDRRAGERHVAREDAGAEVVHRLSLIHI